MTGGVDTHLDMNVAAALDPLGGVLAVAEFPATPAGNRKLLSFLEIHGRVVRVGIEGSYGTSLARYLRKASIDVVEVDRPNRQSRRRTGKSDAADAIEAARAALSGLAQGFGKTQDGNVEAIRALMVAKRSCRSTKIKTLNQTRHLGFTAPDELRERAQVEGIGVTGQTAVAAEEADEGEMRGIDQLGVVDDKAVEAVVVMACLRVDGTRKSRPPGPVDETPTVDPITASICTRPATTRRGRRARVSPTRLDLGRARGLVRVVILRL